MKRPFYPHDEGITFFVHRNHAGAVFVKEGAFFKQQGGLTEEWGRSWHRVYARDHIQAADIARTWTDAHWASCVECGGWGWPTGCPICDCRCMGG